jgi:hypothetical protein
VEDEASRPLVEGLEDRFDRAGEVEAAVRGPQRVEPLGHARVVRAGHRDAGEAVVPAARLGAEHDRDAVPAPLLVEPRRHRLHHVAAGVEGRSVADARAHGVRVVEEHDAFGGALARERREEPFALGEGPRDGEHEERHDPDAEEQQEEVLEPDAAAVPHGRLQQELHRRPLQGAETAAVENVDDDGQRRQREPAQQRGVDDGDREERHRLPVLPRTTRARAARNPASALSSGSPVESSA